MSIIDDIKDKASDMLGSVTGSMGGVAQKALDMTDLDEKAIAMFDEKMGAGKFAEMKQMFADGKITKEEIATMATTAGVPETMIAMVTKLM
jgi:hypothetical protein